jgi:hypothetical protein
VDRFHTTIAVDANSRQVREALLQASYYHGRAEQHQALTERATPIASAVHRQLAAAYRAAATAAERGEPIDLGGDHRAERADDLPAGVAGVPVAPA